MSADAINIAKVGVVVGLYFFLFLLARTMRSHLGRRERPPATEMAVIILQVPGGETVLDVPPSLVLGRGSSADIVLEDPYTSERHILLDRVEGRLVAQDLGSTNGTYVNGARLQGRRALDRGDEIRVGQTIMEVR